MTHPPLPDINKSFKEKIRILKKEDLIQLKPILEYWIKHRDSKKPLPKEVEETLRNMKASIQEKNKRHYLVSETNEGQIVGVVGIKKPDIVMTAFASTSNPTELINFFVAASERGKGIGKRLAANLEEFAKSLGHKEILINSGPRYKDTAWGFYDKLPGYKRIGIAKKYYGEGGDAPVWRKIL